MATIRTYFGLEQRELATWLGVTAAYLGHVEAGRRPLSAGVYERMLPLALQLPEVPLPPDYGAPAKLTLLTDLPASTPTPDHGVLESRRAECGRQANRLRRRLLPLEQRAQYAARWALALPVLLAAVPAPDTPVPPATDPAALDAWLRLHRLRDWLRQRAAPLDPAAVAEWHLLRLRAEALETEAASLDQLLTGK
ncbi:MAG: helix-turn-helix transcriptional regulator [Hymenobacteraceae bacterium]|nr:helix-turn-helix transcriptional regulator [Hymenobacteraceae bacterium]